VRSKALRLWVAACLVACSKEDVEAKGRAACKDYTPDRREIQASANHLRDRIFGKNPVSLEFHTPVTALERLGDSLVTVVDHTGVARRRWQGWQQPKQTVA
jgi:hypothetical protein